MCFLADRFREFSVHVQGEVGSLPSSSSVFLFEYLVSRRVPPKRRNLVMRRAVQKTVRALSVGRSRRFDTHLRLLLYGPKLLSFTLFLPPGDNRNAFQLHL